MSTVELEIEDWHRASMEVIWTDSGKLGVRFIGTHGERVTQFFSLPGPEETQQLTRAWERYRS